VSSLLLLKAEDMAATNKFTSNTAARREYTMKRAVAMPGQQVKLT
jgi:hypothetical protein